MTTQPDYTRLRAAVDEAMRCLRTDYLPPSIREWADDLDAILAQHPALEQPAAAPTDNAQGLRDRTLYVFLQEGDTILATDESCPGPRAEWRPVRNGPFTGYGWHPNLLPMRRLAAPSVSQETRNYSAAPEAPEVACPQCREYSLPCPKCGVGYGETPESEQRERNAVSAEPELGKRPTPQADAEIRAMMVAFDAAVPVFRGPCSYSGMLAARLKLLSIHPTPAASDGGLREALREVMTLAVKPSGKNPNAGFIDMRDWYRLRGIAESALATPQASTPAAASNEVPGNSGSLNSIATAAVAPEQVTDAEALSIHAAFVKAASDYFGMRHGFQIACVRAAGNALLALRAAQQKGGGQ